MTLKEAAFKAFKTDLTSPETEKIIGYKPTWGPVTIAHLEDVWAQLEGESLPPGQGYILFEVALTFGLEVAQAWRGKSVNELEKLLRRKYKNSPVWGEHKHRFMNRVTRVVTRARKMENATASV
jgi:hypothetical protein